MGEGIKSADYEGSHEVIEGALAEPSKVFTAVLGAFCMGQADGNTFLAAKGQFVDDACVALSKLSQ